MNTVTLVLLIITVVLALICLALYIFGKKAEKKQEENRAQLDAMAQSMTMLVIDKKRLKLKEAGFPQVVVDNTPKYLRGAKVPVVKAKVGPKIMTLMCEESIYPLIPVKKEIKAVVSGIYITGVKGLRGALETPQKKQSFFKRLLKKD